MTLHHKQRGDIFVSFEGNMRYISLIKLEPVSWVGWN